MTTTQFAATFKGELKSIYNDREADNIADWVFESVTGVKKWQRRNNQDILSGTQKKQLEKYLKELLQSKPVQYILNEAWFYKRKYYVNEDVLIPRPETEELVEWIIQDLKATQKRKLHIIDIGTGSGCIPVSLKLELSNAVVDAIDISDKALLVAQKNADKLKTCINFFQINFLQNAGWPSLGKYDIIVSNPPYIPINEKKILSKNVADFEPEVALFVKDDEPFIFYRQIADFAQLHLNNGGKIYVEVHEAYAINVKKIFETAGLTAIIKKDIYKKERMVRAEK